MSQLNFEFKGQRASYKLDAGQRPYVKESLQIEELLK